MLRDLPQVENNERVTWFFRWPPPLDAVFGSGNIKFPPTGQYDYYEQLASSAVLLKIRQLEEEDDRLTAEGQRQG